VSASVVNTEQCFDFHMHVVKACLNLDCLKAHGVWLLFHLLVLKHFM